MNALTRSSVRRGVLSACRLRGALLARPLSSLPTVESVRTRPRYVTDLSNDLVFLLAEQGSGAAKRECVRREIMAVDGIEYAATQTRIEEMSALVAEKHPIIRFPYQVGIWSAQISGFASIPLVFSFSVAKIFNDYCVTADPPDVRARSLCSHACSRRAPLLRARTHTCAGGHVRDLVRRPPRSRRWARRTRRWRWARGRGAGWSRRSAPSPSSFSVRARPAADAAQRNAASLRLSAGGGSPHSRHVTWPQHRCPQWGTAAAPPPLRLGHGWGAARCVVQRGRSTTLTLRVGLPTRLALVLVPCVWPGVQFAREKRLEIGVKPFTQRAVEWQGDRLASAYPQYDPYIIHSCARSARRRRRTPRALSTLCATRTRAVDASWSVRSVRVDASCGLRDLSLSWLPCACGVRAACVRLRALGSVRGCALLPSPLACPHLACPSSARAPL
jgi:hypothetical protein